MRAVQILITGASGFVGKNLKCFLSEHGFEISQMSLRDDWKGSLPAQYDAIIHLAGKAHDTKNISLPEEYFQINTGITQSLFDHFLQSSARDFFFFSSVKAVADTVNTVLEESVQPDPKTPYGKSKWLAEQYLNSKELPSDKRLFILRPCMIHGPGNKGNLNLLYQVVSKGIPYPLAAFDNRRSFLSIENLHFVIKRILENPDIPGGTYNLADDETLSTNELIRLIGEARGKKVKLWRISPRLIKTLARLGDNTKLPLNSERLQKLIGNYVVSNQKIKSALEINQLPVSVKEGLLTTLRGF